MDRLRHGFVTRELSLQIRKLGLPHPHRSMGHRPLHALPAHTAESPFVPRLFKPQKAISLKR